MSNDLTPQGSTKTFGHLVAQPALAYRDAIRERSKQFLIMAAFPVAVGALGSLTQKDLPLYGSLVLFAALSIWVAHEHIKRISGDGYSDKDIKIMYAAAVITAGPLAYAQLMIVALATWLAVLALVLAVVGLALRFFGGSEKVKIERGANSHYTSTGDAKVPYFSAAEADLAVVEMAAKGEAMKKYECEKGGHYHIGH